MFQSITQSGTALESQKGIPGLLQPEVKPEAPGQKKASGKRETAVAGSAAAKPGLVGRFHERHALCRQPLPYL